MPKKKNPEQEAPAPSSSDALDAELLNAVETADMSSRVESIVRDDSDEENGVPEPPQKYETEPNHPLPPVSKAPAAPRQDNPRNTNHENQTITSFEYGSDESSVIPEFEREASQIKFDTEKSQRTDAASIHTTLKTYLSQGRHIKGRIAGVTVYNGVPCWSLYQGKVSIYIPFTESYMTVKKSLTGTSTAQLITKQKNFLSQSIGLTVEFVLTSYKQDPEHPGHYIAMASRTTALARKRSAYFGQKMIRPGATVAARIITVSPTNLFVTVAGLDVNMTRKVLSRKPIADLTEHFHIDDTIRLRVMDVDYGSASKLPTLSLSAIPEEDEVWKANSFRLSRNERCHGIVTSIEDGTRNPGNIGRTHLWLEDYEHPAITTVNIEDPDNPISVGDHVLYEHRGFTERGVSHGVILRKLPR